MDAREFPRDEYEARWETAQRAMRAAGLDALIVTSQANYRYLTGHRTAFWGLRDRLRFCVLPQRGEPSILLTPLEDEWARACSWITDLRHHSWEGFATWSDRNESGINEIIANLKALGLAGKKIGMELGVDQRLGMTYRDIDYLIRTFPGDIVDVSEMLWHIRLKKSRRELALLRKSTVILDNAFTDTWTAIREGMPEAQLADVMADSMRIQGADDMSFIFIQSALGKDEVPFRSPVARNLAQGDVIYIDSGAIYQGYKSDYCRMAALGSATDEQRRGYEKVYRVLRACIEAVKPGARIASVVEATERALEREGFENSKLPIRWGHSIGLEMPEPPSVATPIGHVVIEPGSVLCLEPGALVDGRFYQLEEMVFVTDDGTELLSEACPPELVVLN
jgi:Xaa-Pro aminopeptidase